jgi:hypothetical protein
MGLDVRKGRLVEEAPGKRDELVKISFEINPG